jgi:hypothetical protein
VIDGGGAPILSRTGDAADPARRIGRPDRPSAAGDDRGRLCDVVFRHPLTLSAITRIFDFDPNGLRTAATACRRGQYEQIERTSARLLDANS